VCKSNLPIGVFDGIESLMNKNLLRLEEEVGCEPRFIMLETIHEFAREQLHAFGELADLQKRHAEYFTSHVEEVEPHTRGGPEQTHWLRQLESEHDNLRAAYAWAVEDSDPELGLRLVSSLCHFWYRKGHHDEGKQWISWALSVIDSAAPALRADVYFAAGLVASFANDRDQSKSMYQEALALYQELNSTGEVGRTKVFLSFDSVGIESEYKAALAMCEEGVFLLREIDDKAGVAQALNIVGELTRVHGDMPRAKEAYEECLEIAREIGDTLREGIQYLNLGAISLKEGDYKRAQALTLKSLRLSEEIDLIIFTTDALSSLAQAAEVQGDLKQAAVLFGAAERLYEIHGFTPQLSDAPGYEHSRVRLQEKLDSESFEAARLQGWNMSKAEAVAYALDESLLES
jgi:non-specific serine/threonine protein kinase